MSATAIYIKSILDDRIRNLESGIQQFRELEADTGGDYSDVRNELREEIKTARDAKEWVAISDSILKVQRQYFIGITESDLF